MEVKYQIFISSTYEDLKDERQTVIKACLEMGHIPVGMEMFSAADDEQWEIIKRQIDQSDYYVVIVAHRYGSLSGVVSYTEKEYDYAVAQGVPVLAFIIDDNAEWSPRLIESDAAREIAAFKAKLRDRPVDWWRNKDELHSKCAIALMKAFNTRPRPGWIKASDAPDPRVADELTRLSSENATLRSQLSLLQQKDVSGLVQGEDLITLNFTYDKGADLQEYVWTTTWNDLFVVVGRATLRDPSEGEIRLAVKHAFHKEVVKDDRRPWEWYKLANADFEAVKTQFIALDLISVDHVSQTYEENIGMFNNSAKQLTSKMVPLWKLTKNGTDRFSNLVAILRQRTLGSD